MEVKYQVCYLEEVINKHITSLSTKAKTLIKEVIEERLMNRPYWFWKTFTLQPKRS
ncbi:hypothetical protein [Candidatus Tisiphia endosymbiont of Empis tessellata]|uniref:hypothetical protein n=1 Tax=Candidatus Tisiphia endosymbiont of Empis tessellata TaxID=3066259 RepID=UPI00313B1382